MRLLEHALKLKGRLGDGRMLSLGTKLWVNGTAPIFIGFDATRMGASTWPRNFPDRGAESSGEISGAAFWTKPQQAKAPYLDGFSTAVQLYGARNGVSPRGTRSLSYEDLMNAQGMLVLRDSNSSMSLSEGKLVSVSRSDVVKPVEPGADKITMKINRGSGLFRGSIVHPLFGKRAFTGVLLQNSNEGVGFFFGP